MFDAQESRFGKRGAIKQLVLLAVSPKDSRGFLSLGTRSIAQDHPGADESRKVGTRSRISKSSFNGHVSQCCYSLDLCYSCSFAYSQ